MLLHPFHWGPSHVPTSAGTHAHHSKHMQGPSGGGPHHKLVLGTFSQEKGASGLSLTWHWNGNLEPPLSREELQERSRAQLLQTPTPPVQEKWTRFGDPDSRESWDSWHLPLDLMSAVCLSGSWAQIFSWASFTFWIPVEKIYDLCFCAAI